MKRRDTGATATGRTNAETTAENRVCVTASNGMQVWIPESKLEAWKQADHNAPLSSRERALVEEWTRRIYGEHDEK